MKTKKSTIKVKHLKLSTEKKKAWDAFSKYIRARDKKCVTCGAVDNLQAGHFISGRHNSVLFNYKNCHAQCYGCNVGKKGNMVIYYKFMLSKYGQETIDWLIEQDRALIKYTPVLYQDMTKEFKAKLGEIQK